VASFNDIKIIIQQRHNFVKYRIIALLK